MQLVAQRADVRRTRLTVRKSRPAGVHQPACIRYRRVITASTSAVGDGSVDSKDEPQIRASAAAVEDPSIDDQQSTVVSSHAVDVAEDEVDDMFGTKELVQELSDTTQFGKRGEAWFFALSVVMLLVVFPPMRLQGLVELLSTLAISAGVVFLVYALFSLGRNFSPFPSPRKNNTLTTTGMYGYVRHPMYAGLLLLAFGVTIFTGSETRFALSCILWWVLEQKASLEERLLEQLHPEYSDYRSKVKKFLPYVY